MMKSACLTLGLLAMLSLPAQAQLSSSGGPTRIEADTFEIRDREGKAVYEGNVDAIQGDARIRAEKLTVFFESSDPQNNTIGRGLGAFRSLLAEGEVYYLTADEKARGDQGVYDYEKDTITLTGNVTVTRGENVIAGDTLVIDINSGVSRFTANSKRRGERVTTLIVPEPNEQ